MTHVSKEIQLSDSQLLSRRASQVQRGATRAAVLGVNDGLVSTLCIVLAVAAAGASSQSVLIAGFAGLIAGAVSMAAGEWISVTSQVELFEGILKDLKRLVKRDKELLQGNLAESFVATGLDKKTAVNAAKEVAANDKDLYTLYATQVIGLNPDELGSPWVAAGSSFALFTLGALAPLAPWFFIGGTAAIVTSVVLTAAGGLITGGYVATTSGNSVVFGSIRQFLIIVLAASVTYGVGLAFGTTLT